jgi:hypothetical protein
MSAEQKKKKILVQKSLSFEDRQRLFQRGLKWAKAGTILSLIAIFAFLISIVYMAILLEDGPVFPYPLIILPILFLGFIIFGIGHSMKNYAKDENIEMQLNPKNGKPINCIHCGKLNSAGALTCKGCGADINNDLNSDL